jgi:hypothetical protein
MNMTAVVSARWLEQVAMTLYPDQFLIYFWRLTERHALSIADKMSRTFTIDRSALLKIILHSLKYPTTAINGILLGKEKIHSNTDAVQAGGNAGALNGKTKVLHVYDAIPVTHNYIALSGPFEAALAQVDKYCDDNKDQDIGIVGYYQSNERLEDTDLGSDEGMQTGWRPCDLEAWPSW